MRSKLFLAGAVLVLVPAIGLAALRGTMGPGSGKPHPKTPPATAPALSPAVPPNLQPAGSNPTTGQSPAPGSGGQPNPTPVKPAIKNTEPAALIVSSSPQTLKITGTGFQKDLTVTITSPEGKTSTLAPTAVAFVTDKEAQISPIVSSIGAWKMSVLNPDKAASDDF